MNRDDDSHKTGCEHVFRYMETTRYTDFSGGYNTRFVRIDRFYCEKCLHVEDRRQEGFSRDTPEWYK